MRSESLYVVGDLSGVANVSPGSKTTGKPSGKAGRVGGQKPEAFHFLRSAFTAFSLLLLTTAYAAAPPMTLSAALDRAKDQNPVLKAADAEVEAARARGWMLQVPYKPMAALNGFASKGQGEMIFSSTVDPLSYTHMNADEQATLNGMLMWKAFSFGRDGVARRIAEAETGASREMARVEEVELAMRVRLAFSDAVLKRDALAARKAAVDSADEVLRTTQASFGAGKVPEAFVFRAQADASAMRREFAMAQAAADSALASLRSAIGDDQFVDREVGAWDVPLDAPASLADALRAAASQRSELGSLKLTEKGAKLRARLADMSRLPELSLAAMGDWMAMSGTTGDSAYRLGVVISFPIDDAGERRAAGKEQRAMAAKAAADTKTTKLKIDAEVAGAWAEWQASPKVSQASQDELKAGDEAYRVALLRYREGKAILAEVIDARAQLVQAQLAVAEADAYARRSWTMLQRAIGR